MTAYREMHREMCSESLHRKKETTNSLQKQRLRHTDKPKQTSIQDICWKPMAAYLRLPPIAANPRTKPSARIYMLQFLPRVFELPFLQISNTLRLVFTSSYLDHTQTPVRGSQTKHMDVIGVPQLSSAQREMSPPICDLLIAKLR